MATGTFLGHFGPGVFFLFFGLLWLIKSIKICLSGRQHIASTTFMSSCPLFSPYINTEAWMKVIFCVIGITGEIASTADASFNLNFGANNLQHVIMNTFFLINGIVEILITKDKYKTTINDQRPFDKHQAKITIFPDGSDYLTLAVAVFVEGLIFHHHTMGRSAIDVRLHTLLVITISMSFVSILMELKYRECILASMFRALTFCIQGSWMIQVSVFRYRDIIF